MTQREQDGIPYRTMGAVGAAPKPQTTSDEVNYDTLRNVRDLLAQSVAALHKDFNAFDVLKFMESPTIDEASRKLLISILGKQEAYDIVAPLLETVNTAMRIVDEKYKEKR